MNLKQWAKDAFDENYRLITTDRLLQAFMAGVFILLAAVIAGCQWFGDYLDAEEYYRIAGDMLSGTFDYASLGTDLTPVTLLLLIPPRLLSWNADVFCVLFSLYGFAFYMLGGHFTLKSCRATGYSERDAYLLLLMFFLCSLSFMTLSTGPFAAAFTIMALWFFHIRSYTVSFIMLALATMSGFYPVMLFLILLVYMGRRGTLGDARAGIVIYLALCTVLWFFPLHPFGEVPFITLDGHADPACCLGWLYSWIGWMPSASSMFGSAIGYTAGLVLVFTYRTGRDGHTLRTPALLLSVALGLSMFLMPVYSPMQYIWVAMLFPMTQMVSEPYRWQKLAYVTLAAFSVMSLVCNFIVTEGTAFEVASMFRTFAFLAFLLVQASEITPLMTEKTV